MLSLCLCEDEERDRRALQQALEQIMEQEGLPGTVAAFTCGDELLASYPSHVDVLLLDVQMPGRNGIETARAVRERDADVQIVFMTNLAEYAVDGYDVQAFRYLLKPIDRARLAEAIAPLLHRVARAKQAVVTCQGKEGRVMVGARSILYVETGRNKTLYVHTRNGTIETKGGLSSFAAQLDGETFFRCHTSYLVNFSHVERLTAAELRLTDGTRVPVSKHRRRELELAFTRYLAGRF